MDWEKDIKNRGSAHYHASNVEPIDLLRDVNPHISLTALDIKALCDIIKYAFRMLTSGSNIRDCEKIRHYADMVEWRWTRG